MPGAVVGEVLLYLCGGVVEAVCGRRVQLGLQRAPVRPAVEVAVIAPEQPEMGRFRLQGLRLADSSCLSWYAVDVRTMKPDGVCSGDKLLRRVLERSPYFGM